MIFCEFKIREHYKNDIENGKINSEDLTNLVKRIQELHDLGYSQKKVIESVKEMANEIRVNKFYDIARKFEQVTKQEKLLKRVNHPMYSNITDALHDIFYPPTTRTAEGVGLNIQNLKKKYYDNLAGNFDRILMSNDNGFLFQEMRNFTRYEWSQVLQKMLDPTLEVDESIERLASIFDHQNHTHFAEKSNTGVKDLYNPQYLYKRAYDHEKIKSSGLRQFSLDLINSTNFGKLKEGFDANDFDKLKNTFDFLKNTNTTEEQIRKAANDKTHSSEMLSAIIRYYENFTGRVASDLELTELDTFKKGFGLFKEREIEFASIDAELNFMEKYGKHGSNIYKYIKDDAIKISKGLAFHEVFGPNIEEGWNNILRYAEGRSSIEKLPFNKVKAEETYNFMAGKFERIPDSVNMNPFDPESYNLKNVSAIQRDINRISASAYLVGSGLTNAFLDPGNIIAHNILKSNEAFVPRILNFSKHFIESLGEAFKKNPDVFIHLVDIGEKTFGEEMLRNRLKESVPGAAADSAITLGGGRTANKISAILGFKQTNHMIKNGLMKDADVYLARYGLNQTDLDFCINNKIFEQVDSVNMLGLKDLGGKHLIPDHFFKNNPDGISPKLYREKVSTGFSAYLEENRKQFAPHLGDKQESYLIWGNDQNNVASIVSRFTMQFLRMQLKISEDLRMATEMKAVSAGMKEGMPAYSTKDLFKKRALNGATVAATFSASMAIVGFGLKIAKLALKNGGDTEKTNQQLFNKDPKGDMILWQKMLVEATMQYGAGGILFEKLMSGSLETPAIKAIKPPFIAAKAGANYVLGKEPITPIMAKDFVTSSLSLLPFQSAVYMTPWAQEYVNAQKKAARYLDNLDNR